MTSFSPSYYDRAQIESEHKELLIQQFKADNLALRSKEKEYNIMYSQLLEQEHKFKLLQEEKFRQDRESRDKDELHLKAISNLKGDLELIKQSLHEKNLRNGELNSNLNSVRSLIEANDLEIEKSKLEISAIIRENSKIEEENRLLRASVSSLEHFKLNSLESLERAKNDFASICLSKKAGESKIISLDYEANEAAKKLFQTANEAKVLEYEKNKLQVDLSTSIDALILNEKENEKLQMRNARLMEEAKAIQIKSRNLEYQISLIEEKIANISKLILSKEDEINKARLSLTFSEEKNRIANDELLKLKRERETMEILMAKYKQDSDIFKNLKEDQFIKTIDLDSKKKALEKEVLAKTIEITNVKKNLYNAEFVNKELSEEHYYYNKELDALKDHASILENQNLNLHTEVDKIVSTDEKIRADLDRKSKYEYLKSKNMEELQRSAEKVRLSQSPKRSPYKSGY